MLDVVRFWLDMGMDGFRLDAVPYLYEREGTNCENLPETHAFLADAARRSSTASTRQGAARRGQPVARGRGRLLRHRGAPECHMSFHFPLMPRMFMALRSEQRYPITEILERTPHIPRRAVGHLPAQPRRTDPRDGHRRRARLHVGRVRARSAHEAQPRHPPPPRTAAQQRPAPDGTVLRAAALAARRADPLLRR